MEDKTGNTVQMHRTVEAAMDLKKPVALINKYSEDRYSMDPKFEINHIHNFD